MWRILIIGPGDVALRLVPQLTDKFRVYALTRRSASAAALRALGVTPISGDLDERRSLQRIGGIADVVLHLAPPPSSGTTDTRTQNLIAALNSRGGLPRRLVYISTSGVYGDCGGARSMRRGRFSPARRAAHGASMRKAACAIGPERTACA